MKFRKVECTIALGIIVVAVVLIYPMLNKPDMMNSLELTRLKMRQIATQVLNYYADRRSWPDTASWHRQVQPYRSREQTFSPDNLLTDSWGNPIDYRVMTNATGRIRFLQSFGPNRIDDHGSNDDIVLKISGEGVKP